MDLQILFDHVVGASEQRWWHGKWLVVHALVLAAIATLAAITVMR